MNEIMALHKRSSLEILTHGSTQTVRIVGVNTKKRDSILLSIRKRRSRASSTKPSPVFIDLALAHHYLGAEDVLILEKLAKSQADHTHRR